MAGLLTGKRVLVAEDEPILAMSVEDMLTGFGCEVVGPALSAAHATALARDELLDLALLDINMGDQPSYAIAWLLRSKGVPFCFATGYGAAGVPAELSDAPVLTKPYTEQALARVLQQLVS